MNDPPVWKLSRMNDLESDSKSGISGKYQENYWNPSKVVLGIIIVILKEILVRFIHLNLFI